MGKIRFASCLKVILFMIILLGAVAVEASYTVSRIQELDATTGKLLQTYDLDQGILQIFKYKRFLICRTNDGRLIGIDTGNNMKEVWSFKIDDIFLKKYMGEKLKGIAVYSDSVVLLESNKWSYFVNTYDAKPIFSLLSPNSDIELLGNDSHMLMIRDENLGGLRWIDTSNANSSYATFNKDPFVKAYASKDGKTLIYIDKHRIVLYSASNDKWDVLHEFQIDELLQNTDFSHAVFTYYDEKTGMLTIFSNRSRIKIDTKANKLVDEYHWTYVSDVLKGDKGVFSADGKKFFNYGDATSVLVIRDEMLRGIYGSNIAEFSLDGQTLYKVTTNGQPAIWTFNDYGIGTISHYDSPKLPYKVTGFGIKVNKGGRRGNMGDRRGNDSQPDTGAIFVYFNEDYYFTQYLSSEGKVAGNMWGDAETQVAVNSEGHYFMFTYDDYNTNNTVLKTGYIQTCAPKTESTEDHYFWRNKVRAFLGFDNDGWADAYLMQHDPYSLDWDKHDNVLYYNTQYSDPYGDSVVKPHWRFRLNDKFNVKDLHVNRAENRVYVVEDKENLSWYDYIIQLSSIIPVIVTPIVGVSSVEVEVLTIADYEAMLKVASTVQEFIDINFEIEQLLIAESIKKEEEYSAYWLGRMAIGWKESLIEGETGAEAAAAVADEDKVFFQVHDNLERNNFSFFYQ